MIPVDYFWRRTARPIRLQDVRRSYTQEELQIAVEQLANALVKKGVKHQTRVAVICGKTAEQVIAMLSLWTIGAVYVPISLENPQARIDYVLQDCEIAHVIVSDLALSRGVTFAEKIVVRVEAEIFQTPSQINEKLTSADSKLDDIAYIIYTSGTTGRPKGVVISNRALMRLAQTAEETFLELSTQEIFLQVVDFAFDVSIWDMILWLVKRGTLIVIDMQHNVVRLLQAMVEHKPTYICNAAPTYTLLLNMKSMWQDFNFDHIKSIITTASNCPVGTAKGLLESFPKARIYNCYGPTETTVYCCWTELTKPLIDAKTSVPIGSTLPGLQAYLLGPEGLKAATDVDEKIERELCIGGSHLFEGYWKEPALTNDKTAHNAQGERVYRTGDLVTRRGTIFYYVGRIDDTIKIKGNRVNLGEVERCLASSGFVADCAVVDVPSGDCDFELIGFYTPSENNLQSDVRDELKHFAETQLPTYMVPKRFIQLVTMPLSIAGKIDRKQLKQQAANS